MRFLIIIFLIFFMQNNLFANNKFFEEGLKLFNKEQFEKAKFKFEQDIVFNPKSESSYLYLSRIFNKKENTELEEKNLTTVIKLNPKNEEAVYYLAKLKLRNSDFIESQKLVKELLSFCKNYCEKSNQLESEIDKSLKK